MNGWQLLRPEWLLALPPALGALWWFHSRRAAAGRWRSLVDEALQPYVLTRGRDRSGRVLAVAQAVVLSVLLLALAGPVRDRLPQPVYRDNSALIIALDLSQSMNAQDVLPTRIDRARLKVRDLLAKRQQGDTALVVFAGDAFTVTPLTDDVATIEAMLESLSTRTMPRQGSLVAPALVRAARLFEDAGASDGRVLLIADGVADRAQATSAAAELAERGVDVSVLAVGTAEGDVVRNAGGELVKDDRGQIVVARMDTAGLSSVAAAGNGRFALLTADDSDLDALLGDIETSLADGVLSEDFETDVWREVGPSLVLLCLPVVALMFRRGAVVALAALAWMPLPDASASVWGSLWSNDNQQGARLFEQQDYSGAADQFTDPAWAAAAAFRAGDYARSAQLLEGIEEPEALYNKGNALALAGQIEPAMEAYRGALKMAPDHADARHNLDVLEQLPPQENPQGEGGQPPESDDASEGQSQGQGQDPSQGQGASPDGESGDSQNGTGQQPGAEDPQSADDGELADAGEQDGQAGEEQGEGGEDGQSETGDGEADGSTQRLAGAPGEGDAEAERDLAAEQWLRQVPDDPGGLLRRKFQQQYRLRYEGRPEESQPW